MQDKKKNILIILTTIILAGGFITAGTLVMPKTLKNKNENDDTAYIGKSEFTGPLQPENIQKLGKHIYYSDMLWEKRNMDDTEKEDMIAYLSFLDKHTGDDLYICGFNTLSISGEPSVNAYQYLNGAIIPNVFYRTDDNYSYISPTGRAMPLSQLDTSDLIPPQELFDKVLELAEQNRNQMFFSPKDTTPISGTYRLEYDTEADELYYSFRLNEYSEIRVDAKTGNITRQYFWNGVYID
ncbi:MAG: hypothetical protein K6C35_07565 [Eubacterium sp.]|nr:hypothetical protein [Eubacterium sp.]